MDIYENWYLYPAIAYPAGPVSRRGSETVNFMPGTQTCDSLDSNCCHVGC